MILKNPNPSGKTYTPEMIDLLHCSQNPFYFIEKHVKGMRLLHDKEGWSSIESTEEIQSLLANLLSNEKTVTIKFRRSGLSTLWAAYQAWLMLFDLDKKTGRYPLITLAAPRIIMAKESLQKVKNILRSLPRYFDVKIMGEHANGFKLGNNAQISCTVISNEGIRGYNPNYLFIDEVLYAGNLDGFTAAAWGSLNINHAIHISVSARPNTGAILLKMFPKDNYKYMVMEWWKNSHWNTDLCMVKEYPGKSKGEPTVLRVPASMLTTEIVADHLRIGYKLQSKEFNTQKHPGVEGENRLRVEMGEEYLYKTDEEFIKEEEEYQKKLKTEADKKKDDVLKESKGFEGFFDEIRRTSTREYRPRQAVNEKQVIENNLKAAEEILRTRKETADKEARIKMLEQQAMTQLKFPNHLDDLIWTV